MSWSNWERISSIQHLLPRQCLPPVPYGGMNDREELLAFEPESTVKRDRGSLECVAVVIPAYRPDQALGELVHALQRRAYGAPVWAGIVVVDDGSGPEYQDLFSSIASLPSVSVVSHAINLGKGAALKTGINHAICKLPHVFGVVTADADGQHAPEDVARVVARFLEVPNTLVLGSRRFDGKVPVRSAVGNKMTRWVLRALLGPNLTDTQTGLRAIPRSLIPGLLKIPARGYEFELETLIAAKHSNLRVLEEPIRTIYQPGNPTSHFQPLRDSMRILFVLLRFTLISISTAILDNLVFFIGLHFTADILSSQILARTASVLFSYPLVRNAVFLSEEKHSVLLPRYLLLVAANATLAYFGIETLIHHWNVAVLPAKLTVEGLLFIGSFLVQRDWIFTLRACKKVAANWAPSRS